MRWNINWAIIHQLAVEHHANHDVRGEQLPQRALSFGAIRLPAMLATVAGYL